MLRGSPRPAGSTHRSFTMDLRDLSLWIPSCNRGLGTKLAPTRRLAEGFSTMGILTSISTAFHKGGWGMWPILITSIFTIAVIVERAVYLFKSSVDKDKLLALLKSQVMAGNVQGAIKVCSGNPTPITRIVQALVEKGFVARTAHAHDKRRSALALTRAGQNAITELEPIINQNRRRALRGTALEDIARAQKLLDQIVSNCHNGNHQ